MRQKVLSALSRHSDDARNAFFDIAADYQRIDELRRFEADGNAIRAPPQALTLPRAQAFRMKRGRFRLGH